MRIVIRAAALAALAGLAGCVADPEEKAPQCPLAYLRPDAATLTRYDGRGTDITDLTLTARLLDIKGDCSGVLGAKTLKARAHAEMVMTLGPAAPSRTVSVPYNVAVTRHGQLLEKKQLVANVTFPPNVDTVQVRGDEVNFLFPTPDGMGGANYTIYFVFQLTPAELAANQRALAAGASAGAPGAGAP